MSAPPRSSGQHARRSAPAASHKTHTVLVTLGVVLFLYLVLAFASPVMLDHYLESSTRAFSAFGVFVAFSFAMVLVRPIIGTIETGLLGAAALLALALHLTPNAWWVLSSYAICGLFLVAALCALLFSMRGKYLRGLRFSLVAGAIFALAWVSGIAPPYWVMTAVLLGLAAPPASLWASEKVRKRQRAESSNRKKHPNTGAGNKSPSPSPSASNRNATNGQAIVSTVDAVIPHHNFATVVGMVALKRRFADAVFQIVCGWEAGTEPAFQAHDTILDFKRRVEQLREHLGERALAPHDKAPIIKDGERIVIAGGKRRVPLRNGILLYGEPGNGKSYMAEAIAGELGLPFMRFSKGDIASRWIGQTTEQMLAVFDAARKQAPVILFIDELDGLLLDRDKTGSGYTEGRELVNTFLIHIERLRESLVIVLGATNHLAAVDPAAIRDGRFDFKIEVPPPDEAARRALLHQIGRFRGAPCALGKETERLLLKRWEGYSATRVLSITRETAELVRSRLPDDLGSVPLGVEDFERALSNIQGAHGARLPEDAPRLRDVILPQTTHNDLSSLLWRISHPEETAKAGGSLPTGILFYGPPGTGKTMTAKALAKESRWSFLTTSGLDLMNNADSVKNLMKEVREARPALIYIDEADNILASRAGSRASPVLNDLLAVMDGPGGRLSEVIFVAATNCPENIDSAALRGGRFTEKFYFQLPDQAMLSRYLRGWMGRTRAKVLLTIETMTAVLAGESLANVEAILAAAVNHALSRHDGSEVSREDLTHAQTRIRFH